MVRSSSEGQATYTEARSYMLRALVDVLPQLSPEVSSAVVRACLDETPVLDEVETRSALWVTLDGYDDRDRCALATRAAICAFYAGSPPEADEVGDVLEIFDALLNRAQLLVSSRTCSGAPLVTSIAPASGMARLSWMLRVAEADQDWGIENADPRRLVNFASFFNGLPAPATRAVDAVAELVLQSANELLLDAPGRWLEEPQVALAFTRIPWVAPLQARYWRSLAGNPEFPVVTILAGIWPPDSTA